MNIFQNTVQQSASAHLRDSLKLKRDSEGRIVVAFYFNRGKGSGTQEVPLSELPAFIEALAGLSDGVSKSSEGRVPADEMVRRTAHMDDDTGLLSFRCNSGKGAKPATVNPGEIAALVEILRGALPQIEAAAKKL